MAIKYKYTIGKRFFTLYNNHTIFLLNFCNKLPEALTLAFISPIVVTVLSIFILRERVGIHRWIAVFTGFLGVLIILRPGFNEINFYLYLPY